MADTPKPAPRETLPPAEVEPLSAGEQLKAAREALARAQDDARQLRERLESLKRIQAELAAGKAADDLEEADQALLTEEEIPEDDAAAKLGERIAVVEAEQPAKLAEAQAQQQRIETLKKQLTPEEELSNSIDEAMQMFSKEKVSVGDVIKAIALIFAALKKYFNYLKGEFDKAAGTTTESGRQGAETQPAEIGNPREHVRGLLRATPEATTATQLKEKKIAERDTLRASMNGVETGLATARGKLTTAESKLKTLQEKQPAPVQTDLDAAKAEVDTARAEVVRLEQSLTEARTKFAQVERDLNAIDEAVRLVEADRVRLGDLLARARAVLAEGDLKTVLSAITVAAENGLDLKITFKEEANIEKLLQAFKAAGADVNALGVNAETGEVTNPVQLIDALGKLLAQPEAKK